MIETFAVAAAGGALIGIAAAAMLILNGRIAGISGIVGGSLTLDREDLAWRTSFILGLLAGGFALFVVRPSSFPTEIAAGTPALIVAGLLVGFGTRLGSGCTSGHGVCGMARMSPRSFAATATFIVTGATTVVIHRWLGGL